MTDSEDTDTTAEPVDGSVIEDGVRAEQELQDSSMSLGTDKSFLSAVVSTFISTIYTYIFGISNANYARIEQLQQTDSGEIRVTFSVNNSQSDTTCTLPQDTDGSVDLDSYPLLQLLSYKGLDVSEVGKLQGETVPVLLVDDEYQIITPRLTRKALMLFSIFRWFERRNLVYIERLHSVPMKTVQMTGIEIGSVLAILMIGLLLEETSLIPLLLFVPLSIFILFGFIAGSGLVTGSFSEL